MTPSHAMSRQSRPAQTVLAQQCPHGGRRPVPAYKAAAMQPPQSNSKGKNIWAAIIAAATWVSPASGATQTRNTAPRERPVSLAPIVASVITGVVNIRTTEAANGTGTASRKKVSTDELFSMFVGTGPKKSESIAAGSRSMGSGFFLRDTGTIVTNHHVVKGAASIVVFATDLQVYRKASIIGIDPRMDLALLKVRPVQDARPLEFGQSETLRPGDTVFAIGNPFGYGNTVSSGILSAKGRSVGGGALGHMLQTDVPLNPGNSGGPLFSLDGKVIGINTANVIEAQGISFAIPAELASSRLNAIAAGGNRNGAWLGFFGEDLYDDPQFSGAPYGIIVRNVISGSPAAKAGLAKGDVIRQLGGEQITQSGNLGARLTQMSIGEEIILTVFRSGKLLSMTIKTGVAPDRTAGAAALSMDVDTRMF